MTQSAVDTKFPPILQGFERIRPGRLGLLFQVREQHAAADASVDENGPHETEFRGLGLAEEATYAIPRRMCQKALGSLSKVESNPCAGLDAYPCRWHGQPLPSKDCARQEHPPLAVRLHRLACCTLPIMPVRSFAPVLFLTLLLTTPLVSAGQSADTLLVNLEGALSRSLDVSPEVDASEAKRAYAEARLSLASASRFLTEFSASTAHAFAPAIENPNNTPADRLYLDPEVRNDWDNLSPFNRIEFEAIQPIWTWGELGKSIDAARAGVELDAAGVRMTENEVLERTADLYYSLQLADALGRLTREAGDIVDQAKKEIDRLLEEGAPDVDYADLFQVEITEQEFLQRVVEVEESRKLARAALARQLFLPKGQTVEAEANVLEPVTIALLPLEEWQALALSDRPELAGIDAGIRARESLVDVARSDYYPKLFLGLSGKWAYAAGRERQRNPYVSDPFLSRGVQAGLALRQNLNFSQTRAKVQQAEAEHAEVRSQETGLRQLVLFEVEEAYRRVLIARSAVEAREEALLISKRWLRDEQINFDLDLGDTENLVRAVQDNLSLQADREQAVYRFNVAVIRLLQKSGQLSTSLQNGTLLGL